MQDLKNIKKIAVLRANALGDFIVILPALQALRTTYPHAEIVLLGKRWHKEFLVKGRCSVDRVIVVPVKQGIRNEANETEDENEVALFIESMQKEAFDIVINFQGSGKSANPFIKSFKAKLTAGLWTEGAQRLDKNLDYYNYQSEILRYLEVVKLIGASTTDIEPRVNVLDKDVEAVKDLLKELQAKPFVVLNPTAMDVRRMWPIENYATLADELKQRNLEVVFTGSLIDTDIIENVIAEMKYNAVNACGYTISALTALLSKAAFVIGADTGPTHLSQAVNTPTIGFYWAPNFVNWGPLLRGKHYPLISWNMACPFCGITPNDPYPFEPRNGCEHLVSFVRDITMGQVLNAVDHIININKQQEVSATTTALI